MITALLSFLLTFTWNSASADSLDDKIFDNFISNFCFIAEKDIFNFSRPVMGTFRAASDAIDHFNTNCSAKNFKSFADFNKALDNVQDACNKSRSELKDSGMYQGPASDSNNELLKSISLCNQAVKASKAAAAISKQVSESSCGRVKKDLKSQSPVNR